MRTPVRVAIVTGTRADFGLLLPTIEAMGDDERFDPRLIAAAMHLSPAFGNTIEEIAEAGIEVSARVETEPDSDEPGDFGRRIGAAVLGFTRELGRLEPDLLLVLGDRYEMLSAALAATGLGVPIAHVHGGELSLGSLDDAMRHSITKLSHLHFVAARPYAERVCQLGEPPERVRIVGAAGVETIGRLDLLDREALAERLGGIELRPPLAAVTFHPASIDPEAAAGQTDELCEALVSSFDSRGTVVVTLPNDDPGNAAVRERLLALAGGRDNVHAFDSLGAIGYLSLLRAADLVIGNSSSAILEAPSFGLPAVNVGDRQSGRLMGENVISAGPETGAIAAAIARALDPGFRERIEGMESPFGDGRVSARILEAIVAAPEAGELRRKPFIDLPDGPWRGALRLGGTEPSP
jgi:UDP-hydrolysing UDP-N-acetyl-D-glucosamine 2-epimerase